MRTYSRKKPRPQVISDEVCRLCLGKTAPMTPIFGAETRDIFATIAMRIVMCLGLEVAIDDEYPKHICQQCNNQLYRFYIFKKNCAATFRKLKASVTALKNVTSETNTKEEDIQIEIQNKKTNESVIRLHRTENQHIQIVNTNFSQPEHTEDQTDVSVDETEEVADQSLIQSTITSEESTPDVAQTLQLQVTSEEVVLTNQSDELEVREDENVIVDSPLNVDDSTVVNDEVGVTQNKSDSVDIFSSYVVSALVEQGILARRGESLEVLSHNTKTFKLMTAYGSPVIMELVEEEQDVSKVPKLDTPGSNTRCSHCGVRFSSRGALVRHARVHSGERPFACRTCGRAFSQREVLRRHELLHSEQRPFPCAQCPKAYTQRAALGAHVRRHAPLAPPRAHRCPRCPKAFLYPSGLSRHMQVHEGRSYLCEDCPRSFRDKSSLVRHARAHMRRNKPLT